MGILIMASVVYVCSCVNIPKPFDLFCFCFFGKTARTGFYLFPVSLKKRTHDLLLLSPPLTNKAQIKLQTRCLQSPAISGKTCRALVKNNHAAFWWKHEHVTERLQTLVECTLKGYSFLQICDLGREKVLLNTAKKGKREKEIQTTCVLNMKSVVALRFAWVLLLWRHIIPGFPACHALRGLRATHQTPNNLQVNERNT